MRKWTYILFILLLVNIYFVQSKRSGGGSSSSSWSRRSSSHGSGGSTTKSKPQSGWFSSGSAPKQSSNTGAGSSYGWQKPAQKPVAVAKPPSGSTYGWQKPAEVAKPVQNTGGWGTSNYKPATNQMTPNKQPVPNVGTGSTYGWQRPAEVAKPVQNTGGWGISNYKPATNQMTANKQPVQNVGTGGSAYNWPKPADIKPNSGSTYGWQKPPETSKPLQSSGNWGTSNNKPVTNKVTANNQPVSNVAPGGYPVQQGIQKSAGSPAAFSTPQNSANSHGTSYNQGNIHAPSPAPGPTYNGPKKQIINNHYHYGSPAPAYTPSHYGISSSYYPQQNNFGYPGGYYGNNRPSYGGMGLFSSGLGGYGYSGGGNWGGYPSYGGSSGIGSTTKGLLIGAAGGYLASSLVNRISNSWNYAGHGYGYNYYDRYRQDDNYRRSAPPTTTTTTTTAAPPYDPTKDWINCVAFNPATKETLINPNCTCSVTVVTDPMTGQNTSHHDCTPYAQGNRQPFVPQQPIPAYGGTPQSPYGVNNPPPSFNGNLYGAGSSYGGGYPVGPPGTNPVGGGVVPYNVQPYAGQTMNPIGVPSAGIAGQTGDLGLNPVPAAGVQPSVQQVTGQLDPPDNRNEGVSSPLQVPGQMGNPIVNPLEGSAVSSLTEKPVVFLSEVESSTSLTPSQITDLPLSHNSNPVISSTVLPLVGQ